MRILALFVGLVIGSICLPTGAVAFQKTISNENILSSFAKIIKTRQYICQSCTQVEPLDKTHSGLSYEVTCNDNLVYAVTLTAHRDMIVEPIIAHQVDL